MNGSEKASIKELFIQHPEMSAKQIAKSVNQSYYEVLPFLKKLGYTPEAHLKARKAVKEGKKPQTPMKAIEKPKEIEKPKAAPIPFFLPGEYSHVPSPETLESRRQKQLQNTANNLLRMAEKAAQDCDIDTYLKLRKEYEVAARQAEAYRKRGQMNKSEKEISAIEQQYHICK